MNTNGLPRLEADAIHLQDENGGDNGWRAVVNKYYPNKTTKLVISHIAYPDEATARQAAAALRDREWRRITALYEQAV